MTFIGIDPGVSGGISVFTQGWAEPSVYPLGKMTEMDIHNLLKSTEKHHGIHAMLENVHSMPKMGIQTVFVFGKSFGFLRGLLTANEIPFELVAPHKWQKDMGCLTKGDKNISKAAAQRLFPSIKMTHAVADALLIGEYCRRTVNGRTASHALA